MTKNNKSYEDFMVFRKRVMALMEYDNLSYQELAKRMEVENNTLSNWLCGCKKPSEKQLQLLADVLKVSYEFISGKKCQFYLAKEVEILLIFERERMEKEIRIIKNQLFVFEKNTKI